MKYEDFETQLKRAAHEFSTRKKAPTTPGKQFEKGALWAWELLINAHDAVYYEYVLRQELLDRIGEVEAWKESLIKETSVYMAQRDELRNEISTTGNLLIKYDKAGNPYKESNPLYVHLKELQRTIGMQREHLGLSNKVNPKRITENTRKGADEKDPIFRLLQDAKDAMDE